MSETEARSPDLTERRCPLCLEDLSGAAPTYACPGCDVVHHRACVMELGGCGTLGCRRRGQAPRLDPREAAALGCPVCGEVTAVGAPTQVGCRCGRSVHTACMDRHAATCRHAAEPSPRARPRRAPPLLDAYGRWRHRPKLLWGTLGLHTLVVAAVYWLGRDLRFPGSPWSLMGLTGAVFGAPVFFFDGYAQEKLYLLDLRARGEQRGGAPLASLLSAFTFVLPVLGPALYCLLCSGPILEDDDRR